MTETKGIYGQGGGGGSVAQPRTPQEADDTLSSRSTARVLYLLSEGQIQGNASGANIQRDIFLDETPLENQDGSLNFENVAVDFKDGQPNQTPVQGFPAVETEIPVGVDITFTGGSITRQLSNEAATSVRIRIVLPNGLRLQNSETGDITGTRVDFAIAISTQGGPFVEFNLDIEGKASTAYERNYVFTLSTTGPWQIRVRRLIDDATSAGQIDLIRWQSYTGIVDNQLRYPYSALLGIRINADQFQSVPTVGARLRGIRVRVPNNYNTGDRSYSGFWNGQLQAPVWTNNPVWIYYDLLTNERYGCGRFLDASQIDLFSLYAISQYCDELVSDGNGGTEPRFTCNCYIQNRDDAYSVLNGLASVFRGILYWSEGLIVASQDRPADPVRLYTEANVIQEVDDNGNITKAPFTYSGTARRARHTVAIVSYSDPEDFYKSKVEYVEDRAGIERYGYRETEITAFGCASRGQAQRVGRWTLITEQVETETVTFSVATEGLLVRPGEIIKIADPLKAGQRIGGRIMSVTGNTATLDSAISGSGVLSILNSNGEIQEVNVTANGSTVSGLPFSPQVESVWAFSGGAGTRLYRVVGISESEDGSYSITGVLHEPTKYAAVDNGTVVGQSNFTQTGGVQGVTGLSVGVF
jgi:predicted phage tail protein